MLFEWRLTSGVISVIYGSKKITGSLKVCKLSYMETMTVVDEKLNWSKNILLVISCVNHMYMYCKVTVLTLTAEYII